MIEDKKRWNSRHVEKSMRHEIAPIVQKYASHAMVGKALDIACGTGRNTHFLADLGFEVDAVDISDYALSQLRDDPKISKIEVDLDEYNLESNKYQLIVNCNYLNRRLNLQMEDALVDNGVIIFETFIVAHDKPEQGSMNPDYLLRTNELPDVFENLEIVLYNERDDINLRGEHVRIASMVAKKGCTK